MTIILTIVLLAALWLAFLAVYALQRHGLAGCLYLAAAALYAAGDAVRAAQESYRRAWPEYREQAVGEVAR